MGSSGGQGRGRGRGRRARAAFGFGRRLQPTCEAAGKRAFESCPFYLGEAHAPAAIRHTFPTLRAIAILRNPRERTVSAFNDYVRMGRIRGRNASGGGMEALVTEKVGLLASGARTLESYNMRILTSGVYIHGLRPWGATLPRGELLVLRSEDFFADTPAAMGRVQAFLELAAPFAPERLRTAKNRNTMASRSRPSHALNTTLDGFFAPYNEQLYEWAARRGIAFGRWENASAATDVSGPV
jgi:hypothetical protein